MVDVATVYIWHIDGACKFRVAILMNKLLLALLLITTTAKAEWVVLDYLIYPSMEHLYDNAEWKHYLKTSDANYYYDNKSLKHKNNKVIIAVKVNYNEAQEEFYRGDERVRTARHMKTGSFDNLSKSVLKYKQIDCTTNKIRYLGMRLWSESDLKGNTTKIIYDQKKYQPIKEQIEPKINRVGYIASFEKENEEHNEAKLAKLVCKI
jgi:hypothetical protein